MSKILLLHTTFSWSEYSIGCCNHLHISFLFSTFELHQNDDLLPSFYYIMKLTPEETINRIDRMIAKKYPFLKDRIAWKCKVEEAGIVHLSYNVQERIQYELKLEINIFIENEAHKFGVRSITQFEKPKG